ncbi:MAG: hypothetical protein QOI87_77 [Bradyrhizobium sp.]|jgi:hypothetical protein|nr:hypothetical protein [Bradyrhizobium sp.]
MTAAAGLNAPLTNLAPTIVSWGRPPLPRRVVPETGLKGCDMETFCAKTPATLDEIRARVACALERHPLCRSVQFDIVSMPRTGQGGNWTISLQSVAPDALWEASDIVADIQDAYDLSIAA